MPKVTVIVGLPGSGKSHLCKKLEAGGATTFGDVCHPNKKVHPGGLDVVVAALSAGTDCVIEDVSFCVADKRECLAGWLSERVINLEFEWIFFENDRQKCLVNIVDDFLYKGRMDLAERINAYNHLYSRYEIPTDSTTAGVVCRYRLVPNVMHQ